MDPNALATIEGILTDTALWLNEYMGVGYVLVGLTLVEEVRRLESILEEAAEAGARGENPQRYLATKTPTVLRDRIAALEAQAAENTKEMDAIVFAAHMPAEYEYGLPSWINQRLYGEVLRLTDVDGRPIRRSEDVMLQIRQQREIGRLRTAIVRIMEAVRDGAYESALAEAERALPNIRPARGEEVSG